MCPIATAAGRIDWLQFVTLTYAENRVGTSGATECHNIRRRMYWQWVRKIEKSFSIPRGYLLHLPREEKGEKTGRYHWHVLVGGLYHSAGRGMIPSPNPKSDRHRLDALWKQCGSAVGHTWIREYDARLSGVEYVLKGLVGLEWTSAGANAYELNKFDEDVEDRQLILAPSFIRHCAMRSRNRRHQKARVSKLITRDRSALGSSNGLPNPSRLAHPYGDARDRISM